MSISLSDAALMVVLTALIVASIALLAYRVSRSHRDLGTDSDRATYVTLHTASLASAHLREGLRPDGVAKASRHLRSLLGCDALTVTDATSSLAWDGHSPKHSDTVMAMASPVLAAGRTQIYRADSASAPTGSAGRVSSDHAASDHVASVDCAAVGCGGCRLREAVFAPVRIGKRVVGTVGAYTDRAGPSLVRATEEVAAWVGTQVELAELDASRARLMEAEVRALRAQISPHFIYNSLNAIASFINTDPVRARELVVEFADFTRYSFRRQGDFTTLAEELKSIDRYLLLERARFGERLQVSLRIGPEVLSTVIPFLSLQPLVENAVRHGLQSHDGVGHISITAHDAGSQAEVLIEDDGVGIDPDHLRSVLAGHDDGEHVGLRNVDLRLRQVYGHEHGLVIDTAPGAGTLITMRVPKFQPDHSAG